MLTGEYPLLGFTFEVKSLLSAEAFKGKVRSRMRGMFDNRPGPRGWIIGPVFFLCLSPYPQAPSAMGLLRPDSNGSKAVGFAGLDVWGTAMLVVFPWSLLAFWLVTRPGDPGALLLVLGGIFSVLVMWSRNQFHQEAEPILRLLEKIGGPPAGKGSKGQFEAAILRPLNLTLDDQNLGRMTSWAAIEEALDRLETGGVLILSESNETYIQLALVNDEVVIEKREGGKESHFRATPTNGHPVHPSELGPSFSMQDAREILAAHVSYTPMPAFLSWEKMRI